MPERKEKKHSKIGHLASIFDAAGENFYQKHRRKADYQQTLKFSIIFVNTPDTAP